MIVMTTGDDRATVSHWWSPGWLVSDPIWCDPGMALACREHRTHLAQLTQDLVRPLVYILGTAHWCYNFIVDLFFAAPIPDPRALAAELRWRGAISDPPHRLQLRRRRRRRR